MTALREALADYLRVRRAKGVKFKKVGPALEHFVEFLEERAAERVSVELAVESATLTADATDRHRAFAAYLQGIDPGNEVPPWDLLPSGKPRTGRLRGHPVDTAQVDVTRSAAPMADGGSRVALADYLRIRRALGPGALFALSDLTEGVNCKRRDGRSEATARRYASLERGSTREAPLDSRSDGELGRAEEQMCLRAPRPSLKTPRWIAANPS